MKKLNDYEDPVLAYVQDNIIKRKKIILLVTKITAIGSCSKNRVFLSRNYWLIVAPRGNCMFLKQILT